MIEYKKCMYCGSSNLESGYVNTRISINLPEKKLPFGGTSQTIVVPSDAFVCNDCGYIAFFSDPEKRNAK